MDIARSRHNMGVLDCDRIAAHIKIIPAGIDGSIDGDATRAGALALQDVDPVREVRCAILGQHTGAIRPAKINDRVAIMEYTICFIDGIKITGRQFQITLNS